MKKFDFVEGGYVPLGPSGVTDRRLFYCVVVQNAFG
jgi:hypothetical protein